MESTSIKEQTLIESLKYFLDFTACQDISRRAKLGQASMPHTRYPLTCTLIVSLSNSILRSAPKYRRAEGCGGGANKRTDPTLLVEKYCTPTLRRVDPQIIVLLVIVLPKANVTCISRCLLCSPLVAERRKLRVAPPGILFVLSHVRSRQNPSAFTGKLLI